jgi:hypothetical protein
MYSACVKRNGNDRSSVNRATKSPASPAQTPAGQAESIGHAIGRAYKLPGARPAKPAPPRQMPGVGGLPAQKSAAEWQTRANVPRLGRPLRAGPSYETLNSVPTYIWPLAAGGAALGDSLIGAGLGAPIGAIAGATRGNTTEGLGRGLIRGGLTGAGAGLGGMLLPLLLHSVSRSLGHTPSPTSTLAASAAGTGLGGAAGWYGSGKLLGKPVGRPQDAEMDESSAPSGDAEQTARDLQATRRLLALQFTRPESIFGMAKRSGEEKKAQEQRGPKGEYCPHCDARSHQIRRGA